MREVGEQAPEFRLKSLSGSQSGLKDLQQNGFVLLNFWATWCAPCKAEVPVLNEIHRKFRNSGLTVVGIDVEERNDTVSTFYRKRQMQYLVLLDSDGAVAKRYGVLSYPMTVVVDQRGKILFRELKVLNEAAIKRLETITNESTSQN
jgi:peroxiredoxin